jgi:guanine deaminase
MMRLSRILSVVFAVMFQAFGSIESLGSPIAYRGTLLHFLKNPYPDATGSYEFYQDGALVVDRGIVQKVGAYADVLKSIDPSVPWVDYSGKWILPGFVDTHVHYPQTEMIGAYGAQLLEWLNAYTFPTEKQYSNYVYAKKQARFFIDQLLRNGTTSALVFSTVHKESVDAFFEASLEKNLRMISGKVLMDRNAPDYLLDTALSGYQDSKDLIKKWHGQGRLSYAITPRFAPTSTPEQLKQAGALKKEFPDVYIHTHLSENQAEIEWVKSLFPQHQGYLDVYDSFGLTGKRSVFAHSVHLTAAEFATMAATDSVAAFCPTSNLFLGSGLFPIKTFRDQNIRYGLGTDVGAGTSFSMFQTLNEAYKVAQLQGQKLSSLDGFYRATLGGAQALDLDAKIGNLLPGKEADFVVLEPKSTPLTTMRHENSQTLEEKLFVLMTLGDDRNVFATYSMGDLVFSQGSSSSPK